MDYYKIMDLFKEPFSNSPDPDFFFPSTRHLSCLQQLELSIRLKRGLNVVIGDVGTGKTTLCRHIIRLFADDPAFETHLVLDPHYCSTTEFLSAVAYLFEPDKIMRAGDLNDFQLKEMIKNYLFKIGVKQNKTITLIFDEGQKIPEFALEILREFLNYETNEHKLLQVVIFAQKEFVDTLKSYHNFTDRINLFHELKPLGFNDVRNLIKYRLEQAGAFCDKNSLFSLPAIWKIHDYSGGYPRKIINLCHKTLMVMLIRNKNKAGIFEVLSAFKKYKLQRPPKNAVPLKPALITIGILTVIFISMFSLVLNTGAVLQKAGKDRDAQTKPSDVRAPSMGSFEFSMPDQMKYGVTGDSPQQSNHAFKITPLHEKENILADKVRKKKKRFASLSYDDVEEPELTIDTLKKKEDVTKPAQGMTDDRKYLGTINIRSGWCLSLLVHKIYGVEDLKSVMERIVLTNPNISDPENIPLNDPITFPKIPVFSRGVSGKKRLWVLLDKTYNLESAFEMIRYYLSRDVQTRIIAYQPPEETIITYSIVLTGPFYHQDEVGAALDQAGLNRMPDIKIINGWNTEYAYYSDPYWVRPEDRT